MKTEKYRVLVYQGFYWLKDCGVFDSFKEAQDKLLEECEKYSYDPEHPEDYESNKEVFLFDSRIKPVTENEEKNEN